MNWYKFPYPLMVTLIYLFLGQTFELWDKAWLVYLTIPIYYAMITTFRPKRKIKEVREDLEGKDEEGDWSEF